jgi:type VI secretion system secreted protein VgrG
MPPVATTTARPIVVTTNQDTVSGPPVFIPTSFQACEAISQLFHAVLDVAVDKRVNFTFDQLLGSAIAIDLPDSQYRNTRCFHGICRQVRQRGSDLTFNHFTFDLVPQAWLLTKRVQSRIFQQTTVPDILRKVLSGLDPAPAIELSGFEPRDYCVQYRESDWDFACRLMEEEGIFYYFRHLADGHRLIIGNTPASHRDVVFNQKITFRASTSPANGEDVITEFGKTQRVVSGAVTLWDHNFELPHKHLEADRKILPKVAVGQAMHSLQYGDNWRWELYTYPGEYAERFDGVTPGGGDRAGDLRKIFDDNQRTADIRMEQEAATAIEIHGASTCRQLTPGCKFVLETLPGDALGRGLKADGTYLVTSVTHEAQTPAGQRSGTDASFRYTNRFTAMPIGLPYRPPRVTPRPRVPGSQTAVVCGPKGQEIFTDKYGRVKVQFHWDREGKNDGDSSCWVRVATLWAGRHWGATHIPRVGQEVVVDFLEGEPDRPIIVGSVYNAEQMPPYLGDGPDAQHRNDPKLSGVKSNTTPGGKGYNELRFDDTKGKEQVFIHAEGNYDLRVKASSMTSVGGSENLTVGHEKDGKKSGDIKQRVFNDFHHHVGNDEIRWVEHDRHDTVEKNVIEEVISGGHYSAVPNGNVVQHGKAIFVTSDTDLVLQAANLYMNATSMIQLNVGGNLVTIDATGVTVFGTLTKVNCPGSVARPVPPVPPVPPADGILCGSNTLKPDEPDFADGAVSGAKSAPLTQ